MVGLDVRAFIENPEVVPGLKLAGTELNPVAVSHSFVIP